MLVTGRSDRVFTAIVLILFLVCNMRVNCVSEQYNADQEVQEATESLLPVSIKGAKNEYSTQLMSAFKSRLLRLFGLKSRPKPIKHFDIPEYMIELYHRQSATSDNGRHRREWHQTRPISVYGDANTVISHAQQQQSGMQFTHS